MNFEKEEMESLIQQMITEAEEHPAELTQEMKPREKSQELFDLAEILLKIIDEYIEEETLLLAERDAFARSIRYDPKEKLNYRLTSRYSRYGLDEAEDDTVRQRVIAQKNEELNLSKLNKAIVQLKSLHKHLVSTAYDLREIDRRKQA